jgi:hypothetical protein
VVSVFKDANNEIIKDDLINHQNSQQALNYVKSNINQIDDDEIMGIVFHAFDYYRFPDIYRELFSFMNQSSVNNKSIRCLMNDCTVTGLDANLSTRTIQVYPNPTSGLISVRGKDIDSVVIINMNGQLIQQFSSPLDQYTIDISTQPIGVYIIKIVTKTAVITKQIIKK